MDAFAQMELDRLGMPSQICCASIGSFVGRLHEGLSQSVSCFAVTASTSVLLGPGAVDHLQYLNAS